MKKARLIFILSWSLLINFLTHAQTAINQPNDLSWYKMLTGKIGVYPITMHLHKAGHVYRGYYYYTSTQEPIYFEGDDTMYDGRIVVGCYLGESLNETFDIGFEGDSATGSWMQNETGDKLRFAAAVAKLPVEFTYVYTEGEKKLKPELEESSSATFYESSIWPLGGSQTDEFLRQSIREYFSKNPGNEEIGAQLLREKKEFFAGYLEENKTVTQADIEESAIFYNKSSSEQLIILFQNRSILSLAGIGYVYDGGAHGLEGTSYMLFDLKNKKKLTLSDVLTEAAQKKLRGLLEKHFREQYKLKPGQSLKDGGLFEDKIEANDNFFLTGKGIGFTYNPYEIGPYAMGEIDLFIPFTELGEGLKPEMKMLLQ